MKRKYIGTLIGAVLLSFVFANLARATVWPAPVIPQVGPSDTSIKPQGVVSNGGAVYTGSVALNNIGTPSAPTMTVNGTVGSTSLIYACTALDINGNATIPSATATVTTANATLTATNSVTVSCGGQTGAVAYLIHKADTSHVIGMCYTTPGASCTFTDQNLVGTVGAGGSVSYTYTPNTIDATGGFTGTNASKINSCAGNVKLVAGTLEVTAPCASSYSYCNCSISQLTTPVAGEVCSCGVTSTATVINSATVTVGAILLNIAGTPSPSPVVNYWAGPQ